MDPLKKIYRDIKNNIRNALPIIAYEIGDKMFKQYVNCVEAFYEDKDETDNYYRTYSTYLGSSISYSYGESSTGSLRSKDGETTTFSAHITMHVDPSYLGNPYKDPTDYVFDRTWSQGIHGTLYNPKMSRPPQLRFEEWFNSFKGAGDEKKRGGEVAAITYRHMRRYAGIG